MAPAETDKEEARPEALQVGEPSAARTHGEEHRRVWTTLAFFFVLFFAVWVVFWGISRLLPGVQPGANQVFQDKLRLVEGGQLFPSDAKMRVLIFGDSRILSGFVPKTFDSLAGPETTSWNLGFPGANRFVDELERLVDRGQTPTHVLLTLPWVTDGPKSLYDCLRDDDSLMDTCFPFRKLPRDAALFVIRARTCGGLKACYESSIATVAKVRNSRGYYFIEGQSHFADNRLPDDFCLNSDTPNCVYCRDVDLLRPAFARLRQVMDRGKFKVYFVPCYERKTKQAAAKYNEALAAKLAPYGIEVLGPDYWVMDNRHFADPVHLNPEGADIYTRNLWQLVQPVIGTQAAGAQSRPATISLAQ